MKTRIFPFSPRQKIKGQVHRGSVLVTAAALTAPGLVIAGISPALAADTTYYVDCENGDDANDGIAPDSAFASLNKAILQANGANDPATIEVAAGECDISDGVADITSSMTITGAGSENSGADVTTLDGDGEWVTPFLIDPEEIDADTDISISGFHVTASYGGIQLEEIDDDDDGDILALLGSLSASDLTFDTLGDAAIEVKATGAPNVSVQDVVSKASGDAAFWFVIDGGEFLLHNVTSDGSNASGLGAELGGSVEASIKNISVEDSTSSLNALTIRSFDEANVTIAGLHSADNNRNGVEISASGQSEVAAADISTEDHDYGDAGVEFRTYGDALLTVSGVTTNNDLPGIVAKAASSELLTLENVEVQAHSDGAGIEIHDGILADKGSVLLDDVQVTGGTAGIAAFMQTDGDLTIRNSAVQDSAGPGIVFPRIDADEKVVNSEGTIVIEDSSVTDNVTGIAFASAASGPVSLDIARTTVNSNEGVGLLLVPDESSEDLLNVSVVNSTFSGNVVGQIEANGPSLAPLEIAHSTLVAPTDSRHYALYVVDAGVHATHTIIDASDGFAHPDSSALYLDPSREDSSVNYSLLRDLEDESWAEQVVQSGEGNLVDVDAQLAALADNGGKTLTHLPDEESPVVDAGLEAADLPGAPDTDQRGLPRFGSPADIGSVELVKETEPTDPDPTGPTDPTDPEPTDPPEPTKPSEPSKPKPSETPGPTPVVMQPSFTG